MSDRLFVHVVQGGVEQVREHLVMPPPFRGLSGTFLLDDLPLPPALHSTPLSPVRGQPSWSLSEFDQLLGMRNHSLGQNVMWQAPNASSSRSPSVSVAL